MDRRGMTKAGDSWRELLGYSVQDLLVHIEKQFTKKNRMTWRNMDQWHIDHITPLVDFHFTSVEDPGFKKAWALPNLRPLWGVDNVNKGTKRLLLL